MTHTFTSKTGKNFTAVFSHNMTGYENGWMFVELTEALKNEISTACNAKSDAVRIEKESRAATPKGEGFQIEYHGDHEIWNGIRMD